MRERGLCLRRKFTKIFTVTKLNGMGCCSVKVFDALHKRHDQPGRQWQLASYMGDNGSSGSWVTQVNKSAWVTPVTGQYT